MALTLFLTECIMEFTITILEGACNMAEKITKKVEEQNAREIKVVYVGLGPIGSRIGRHIIAKRKGMRYVGAIDVLPEIVGKDLGEVIGAGRKLGIKVSDEPKKLFEETKPDIAVYTTTPFLKDILPQIEPAIESGVPVPK